MLVVAHRGARVRAPENTMPAFERALAEGAAALEFDVLVTLDGVPVVTHDENLSRVAGVDRCVSQSSFEEIRSLDVSAGCPGWTDPARIPSLAEVLEVFAGRADLFVELKAVVDPVAGFRSSSVAAEAAWPLLRGVPRVVVSSFDPQGPALIRSLSQGTTPIALGAVAAMAGAPFVPLARDAGAVQLHVEASIATPEMTAEAHEAGMQLLAWTVNDPAEARRLDGLGVDGIFTDDPGGMLSALDG